MAAPVLTHRIITTFAAQAEGMPGSGVRISWLVWAASQPDAAQHWAATGYVSTSSVASASSSAQSLHA